MTGFVLTVELETRSMAGKQLLCINKPDGSGNSGTVYQLAASKKGTNIQNSDLKYINIFIPQCPEYHG